MKATKYTVRITLEMLSLECGPSLLKDAEMLLNQQINQAYLSHDDGDSIEIRIDKEEIGF